MTVQQVRNQLYYCIVHMQQAFSDRAYQYYELFAISNQELVVNLPFYM